MYGRLFLKCVRNVIERQVKKLQLHNIKVSSTTVWRYMTSKGWFKFKALKPWKPWKVQVQSWFKLVQSWSKNGSSSKPWSLEALKALKALKRKKRRTCRHGVRRIWKLYSKGRPANKLTWCEPSGDHLDYRWRENIQRTSPQITGRAKAVTMLRLEKCVFRHTLGARIFYTSPLRKCQKTQRKTFW